MMDIAESCGIAITYIRAASGRFCYRSFQIPPGPVKSHSILSWFRCYDVMGHGPARVKEPPKKLL
jgi:hypothetical protein